MNALNITFFFLFVIACANAESGSILVRNGGGYVATFSVSWDLNGKSDSGSSGDFTLGVNKEVAIPEGATNIYLKVQEYWLPTLLTTIFTKSYSSPVHKCFEIYGTTLNPGYSEVDC